MKDKGKIITRGRWSVGWIGGGRGGFVSVRSVGGESWGLALYTLFSY